jgi:hypothetical protein
MSGTTQGRRKDVVEIGDAPVDAILFETRATMSNGAEVIAQAYLKRDSFDGMSMRANSDFFTPNRHDRFCHMNLLQC